MKKICVLGSLNVDMTVSVPYFNQPGESLTGTGLADYTGGKGGNQAVAAARLGADVTMIGCLGGDGNGALYRETLEREGIHADGVATIPDAPSGMAFVAPPAASISCCISHETISAIEPTESAANTENPKVSRFPR